MDPNSQPKSAVVELTADLNVTIEQLKEIGAKLTSVGGCHGAGDYAHIDEVIDTLQELDTKRLKAHEHLETETIRASVLRHRLANFLYKLKTDIDAIVGSARETNILELNRLQSHLTEINEEVSQLENKQKVFGEQNQVLESEKDSFKTHHVDMVEKLNACMGNKAKLQIRLNETCEDLRETHSEIDNLKSGTDILDQDMSVFTLEFTQEKGTLTEQTIDTKTRSNKRKALILVLQTRLEQCSEDSIKACLAIADKRKVLDDVEATISKLLTLEIKLKKKLEVDAAKTLSFDHDCSTVEQDTIQIGKEHVIKKAEVLKKTGLFKREVEIASKESERLSEIKKFLVTKNKHVQEKYDMHERSLMDIQETVTVSKRTLVSQTNNAARLEEENKQLAFGMAQLNETHLFTVQFLKDDIVESKGSLEQTNQARQSVEAEYSTLQAQVEEHQKQNADTMLSLSSRINNSKKVHSETSEKIELFQEEMRALDASITQQRQQLQTTLSKYHHTRTSLSDEVGTLEQNIRDVNEETSDRNETLSEIEPLCESLETEFKEKDGLYESRKTDVIALKSKRSQLEDDIKRIERELEKILLPQEKLRFDSLRCRAYTRLRLRGRVLEVEDIEKKVAEAHQKLLALSNENKRIEQTSDSLKKEIVSLRALSDGSKQMEEYFDEALRLYRGDLKEQWKENDKMEKSASARDKVLLRDLNALRIASEDRLETIAMIHDNYKQELHKFTDFIRATAQAEN